MPLAESFPPPTLSPPFPGFSLAPSPLSRLRGQRKTGRSRHPPRKKGGGDHHHTRPYTTPPLPAAARRPPGAGSPIPHPRSGPPTAPSSPPRPHMSSFRTPLAAPPSPPGWTERSGGLRLWVWGMGQPAPYRGPPPSQKRPRSKSPLDATDTRVYTTASRSGSLGGPSGWGRWRTHLPHSTRHTRKPLLTRAPPICYVLVPDAKAHDRRETVPCIKMPVAAATNT